MSDVLDLPDQYDVHPITKVVRGPKRASYDRKLVHGIIDDALICHVGTVADACLCVTHLDGLVMARSAFHHSANYRSVVIYGKGEVVSDDEGKMEHSRLFMEKLEPGRWGTIREPNKQELKATMFLGFDLNEVSAKVRAGDPVDDDEDYGLPVWAGVLPCQNVWGTPIDDAKIDPGFVGKGKKPE